MSANLSEPLEQNFVFYRPAPDKLDKHFDFLEWSPDGEVLLIGTSDLSSRFWSGSVWMYRGEECQKCEDSAVSWRPDPQKYLVASSLNTGVAAARFLDDSKHFVIGSDSGALQIIHVKETDEKKLKFEPQGFLSEHDDMILGIDNLGEDNANVVSCSQDRSIKVWDFNNLISEHTYSPAHNRAVTSICTQWTKENNKHSNIFASCSLDGTATLWDTRNSKPAFSLWKTGTIGLTALAWTNSYTLAMGGVDGKVLVLDTRNSSMLSSTQLERRPIYSLRSLVSMPNLVAACQDVSKVTVMKISNDDSPKIVYTDDRHEDFIRGLSWHPKRSSLWTAGWDSQIFSHNVLNNLVVNNGIQ